MLLVDLEVLLKGEDGNEEVVVVLWKKNEKMEEEDEVLVVKKLVNQGEEGLGEGEKAKKRVRETKANMKA